MARVGSQSAVDRAAEIRPPRLLHLALDRATNQQSSRRNPPSGKTPIPAIPTCVEYECENESRTVTTMGFGRMRVTALIAPVDRVLLVMRVMAEAFDQIDVVHSLNQGRKFHMDTVAWRAPSSYPPMLD